jgi:hypothetical protein
MNFDICPVVVPSVHENVVHIDGVRREFVTLTFGRRTYQGFSELELAQSFVRAAKAALLASTPRTPWYEACQYKPARTGSYEARLNGAVLMLRWDGERWNLSDGRCTSFGMVRGDYWRGLAESIGFAE